MRLDPGKCSYQLPPIGKIVTVAISDPARVGYVLLLAYRQIDDLIDMRLANRPAGKPEKCDMPEYYSLSHHGDILELCPAPDKAYDCRVKYFPPVREI